MTDLTRDDLALALGNLLIENIALNKRLLELQPPSENGQVDLSDMPQPLSRAHRDQAETPEP